VYDFFWTQICDGYVEYAKDAPNKDVAFAILRDVFWKALRLLHPYMPFVTEEVAHQLGYLAEGETIMRAKFPAGYTDEEKAAWGLSREVYDFVNAKREAITALRALGAEYKVPPSAFVKVTLATDDPRAQDERESLRKAMRAETVDFAPAGAELAMPSKMTPFGTVYLSLEGLVDKAAESKRIAGELAKLAGFVKSSEAKLANENFVAHAPEAVVAEARRKLAENKEKIAQLEEEAAKQEDRYKRILAEYDNFRKRTQKEKETTYQDAQLATVAAFLPVLDNLERGAAQETADEGVKLILKQFREILQKYHVEPCAEAGQAFDPNFHNAVLHEEGEGSGETVIAQVLQKGYTMNGKLIRAAMVKTTD
jgi:molecular chaperone GrpE (heat shock protein)